MGLAPPGLRSLFVLVGLLSLGQVGLCAKLSEPSAERVAELAKSIIARLWLDFPRERERAINQIPAPPVDVAKRNTHHQTFNLLGDQGGSWSIGDPRRLQTCGGGWRTLEEFQ